MLKTNDLLLEIGCEELPAHVVKPLVNQIQQLFLECLTQKQISFGSNSTLATPRRVTIIIKDVSSTTPKQTITKKGPYLNTALDELKKPKPSAVGFAKACGVTFEELSTTIDAKGERLSYEHTMPGQSIIELLAIWLQDEVINKIGNIKMMRWGSHESLSFPRPVHWILGKYGNNTIPGKLLGCPIQNQTFGHRFHHPKSLIIKNATTYADQLRQAYVEVDMENRKEIIKKQITQVTPKEHLALVDEQLLDEVTQLVEWPEALLGEFDSSFLQLPPEALQAVMHKHQRCFLVKSKETDQLAPYFITISNIKSTKPEQVIAGNRKVMRARLSDAMFFYEQDRQLSLADHAKRLNHIVYQKQLGTLTDKTKRLTHAAVKLAELLSLDLNSLQTCCILCKADLVCSLVNEFPELHGAVGYHLALHEKINPKIADAILNHLKPTGGQDSLPAEPMAQALAILDRADHLVGFFGINQIPSGDKDPFALRRSAIGLLELILGLPVSLSLDEIIKNTIETYPASTLSHTDDLTSKLKQFIFDRLTAKCQDQGIPLGLKQGLVIHDKQPLYLQAVVRCLETLHQFYQTSEIESFIAAHKRVHNLTKSVNLEDLRSTPAIDKSLCTTQAEKELLKNLETTQRFFAAQNPKEMDYNQAIYELCKLIPVINQFLDDVMIMVDDIALQQNRINILLTIRLLFLHVADFSSIPYDNLLKNCSVV